MAFRPFLIVLAVDFLTLVGPLGEEVAVNALASPLRAAPLGEAFTFTDVIGVHHTLLGGGAPLITELALRDSCARIPCPAEIVASTAAASGVPSPDLALVARRSHTLSETVRPAAHVSAVDPTAPLLLPAVVEALCANASLLID